MKVFTTLILLFSFIYCYAQPVVEFDINPNNLKAEVKTLSGYKFQGRFPGNKNHAEVISYIENSFKENKLQQFQSSYLQPFNLYLLSNQEFLLKIKNKTYREDDQLFNFGFEFLNNFKKASIVFGGDGSPQFLNHIEARGNLVVIFKKNIHDNSKESYYLRRKDALGIIVVAENDNGLSLEKRTSENIIKLHSIRSEMPDTSEYFLTIYASERRIRKILGCKKKLIDQSIAEKNPALIPAVTASVLATTQIQNTPTANVIGYIPGNEHPDECVIVSAHYDHLQPEGSIYFPGADDNASGVTGMIAIMNAIQSSGIPPKRTIVFAAFSAEEYGILGSGYYINHPLFPLEQTKVCVNLDMIGRFDEKHKNNKDFIYLAGTDRSPNLQELIIQSSQNGEISIDTSQNNSYDLTNPFRRSDHINFWEKDIPSAFFISGLHDDYHKPTDTYEKLDYIVMSKRVKFFSNVVWKLANTDQQFLINKNPGTKHEYSILEKLDQRMDSICNKYYGDK